MIYLNKEKIQNFLLDRWNHLVNKEKGMQGIRGGEQFELAKIDAVLNFIVEISNKIESGEFA